MSEPHKPKAEWLADVANALAAWINQQPIEKDVEGNPTISPVYDAWSVLSALAAQESEPSVPLSAIRALVQQWIQRWRIEAGFASNGVIAETKRQCADDLVNGLAQLAALCPAPPEDQT